MAFDLVGRDVLVGFDPADEFGRDILEAQRAAAVGREDVAAVELRADIGKAANDDAGAFDRETRGVRGLFETADVHAGNTLQRFGDRTVGQRADIFGGDHVDHGIGAALDRLRGLQRGAEAGDDDRGIGLFGGLGGFVGCGILRQCGAGRRDRQCRSRARCKQAPTRREPNLGHDVISPHAAPVVARNCGCGAF